MGDVDLDIWLKNIFNYLFNIFFYYLFNTVQPKLVLA